MFTAEHKSPAANATGDSSFQYSVLLVRDYFATRVQSPPIAVVEIG